MNLFRISTIFRGRGQLNGEQGEKKFRANDRLIALRHSHPFQPARWKSLTSRRAAPQPPLLNWRVCGKRFAGGPDEFADLSVVRGIFTRIPSLVAAGLRPVEQKFCQAPGTEPESVTFELFQRPALLRDQFRGRCFIGLGLSGRKREKSSLRTKPASQRWTAFRWFRYACRKR